VNAFKQHGSDPYDSEAAEQFVDQYDQSVTQLESLIVSIEKGVANDLDATESITRDALGNALQDFDLFVRLGINPPPGDHTNRHSLHVAMLAASVGARMGWDEKTLLELGMGCLLHDIGMSQVSNRTFRTEQWLNDGEFAEIAAHPLLTFNLLADNLERVPLTSRLVAYQIHERCNGTGYPRGRKGKQIHEVAKVAAVADVYGALVSPRPHRPALMPYHAVLHLIQGVTSGAFDRRAVRALLKTVSLFPIGSCLELQDGRKARVLRSNAAEFGKPIVEAWWPSELDASPKIIDLARAPDLAVKRVLPNLMA
jgi:HD-GYP domain-containing protein (c-di-GMP phosphodiesterase class II)